MAAPTEFQQLFLEINKPTQHLLVTAPPGAGKTTALLLHTLTLLINEEQGIMAVVVNSKELAQTVHRLLGALTQLPIVDLGVRQPPNYPPKAIIIGNPKQLNNLWKKEKDAICLVVMPEADYLFSYGYGSDMELLAGSLNCARVHYKVSCVEASEEMVKFKKEWMRGVVKVDYAPPEDQPSAPQEEEQVTHFYSVGDQLTPAISLYITLKFGLVNPKTLLLVDSLKAVYKYALLLERCGVSHVTTYNHQNPSDLKFYIIRVWLTGSANVLIATPQLLADIDSPLFRTQLKQNKHTRNQQRLQLTTMSSIISIGLSHLPELPAVLGHFHQKPLLMTFLENTEEEVGRLQQWINAEKEAYAHAAVKELPISRTEMEGFKYRVNDVWSTLTAHRVDMYRQLDFKKKLLKSPQLKEELDQQQGQRQTLVDEINALRKKIDHGQVVLPEVVPEYMVPECLKAAYQQQMALSQAKLEEKAPLSQKKVSRALRHVDLD